MTRPNSNRTVIPMPVASPSTSAPEAVSIRKPLAVRLLRLAFQVGGRVAPQLTGRWANYLWFRPQRFVPPAREQALLARAMCLPMTHAGKHIAVYAWGTGPAILLVHGWSGRGAQMGAFIDPLVAAGFRVIAFDAPAHGRSEGEDTNLPEVAELMLELAWRHGPLHAVIAHSFGVLCTLYALGEGLSVTHVVAVSPPSSIEGLVDKFAEGLAIPAAAIKVMRSLFEARFGADLWTRFSPLRLARTTTAQALIAHDDTDREVPWQEGEALTQAWPGAQLLRTHGLGHRRILRDPQVIAQVVGFITNKPVKMAGNNVDPHT